MKFHYLLVDDLVGKEEFERLVAEKVEESGDLLDARTAAMLVVKGLGRAHVQIHDITPASSLACFFAKVLSVGEPREFERPDGTTGLVANVMVGDETGRIRLTFWDEKAAGVHEIASGDVLEILGRPRAGGRSPDVTVIAAQLADCEISCPEDTRKDALLEPREDLEVRLIAIENPRIFTRRDGSVGEMVEGVIGNEKGAFRLVCWAPSILEGVEAGTSIRIKGAEARENRQGQGIEYSIGKTASISPLDREVDVSLDALADVQEGRSYSLTGTVTDVQPPHSFITRTGRRSSVRNLVIADETGEIPVVIWGEKAEEPLVPGDRLEIYNAEARRGRYGDLEVHLSWGSALVVLVEEAEEVVGVVEGTVIATRQGVCLDTGDTCYLLAEPLPVGYEVRAQGTLYRGVITLDHAEAVVPDPDDLRRRLDRFSGET